MVDTAKLAAMAGTINDEAFRARVDAAVAELESRLGYSICGTTEPEARVFNYRRGDSSHRLAPLYEAPTLVRIFDGTNWTTVNASDYLLQQNGQLSGSWFNALRFTNVLPLTAPLSLAYCPPGRGYLIEVTAKWGFGEPTTEGDNTYCNVPADLLSIIAYAARGGEEVQSESVGTRSYTKFKPQTTWDKYAAVMNRYVQRPRRFA